MRRHVIPAVLCGLVSAAGLAAQAPQFSQQVRGFIKVDEPVVASKNIADVRKVETVFKQGIGFDPAKLIASVTGRVGLW